MEKKPNLNQIEHIRNDLRRLRKTFNVYLSPFRALALARSVAGISAEILSQELGISRSYLASLENYTKPITRDLYLRLLELYSASRKQEDSSIDNPKSNMKNDISLIFDVYEQIVCDKSIPEISNVKSSIHTQSEYFFLLSTFSSSPSCIELLQNLCFQAVSSYPDVFDITWHDTPFISPAMSTPLTWQKEDSYIYIPRTILISPENLFIAWAAGIISSDKLVSYYKTKKAAPLALVDCRYGYQNPSPLAIEGFAAFLFNTISLELHRTHQFSAGLLSGGKTPLLTVKTNITIAGAKEIVLVADDDFEDFYAMIEEDFEDEEE